MLAEPAALERFDRDLLTLIARDERLGIAVSGGPDSLALLLLAAAALPGRIEAATVDHALRPGSRDEAEMVATVCAKLGVPHAILTAEWDARPETAVEERARDERYRLLGRWAKHRNLDALVTAHHVDDQAETLVMRLARGSGVRGLSGMRPRSMAPGTDVPLVRPLLQWRRADLARVVELAGLRAVDDPSNGDEKYERVRVRRLLAREHWFDSEALGASATNLREADTALDWAAAREWERAVSEAAGEIVYRPDSAPPEIQRRIVMRAVAALATEGHPAQFRGRELDRLLTSLTSGEQSTLRGVRCSGGTEWRFSRAAPRRGPTARGTS